MLIFKFSSFLTFFLLVLNLNTSHVDIQANIIQGILVTGDLNTSHVDIQGIKTSLFYYV